MSKSEADVLSALIEAARAVAARQRELLDTLDEALDRADERLAEQQEKTA
jgi:uncharacterized protein YpiB (UPF0302 family)